MISLKLIKGFIILNITNAKWFIKHHTTHRYHMLDLRQPKTRVKTSDSYRYGWVDSDAQLRFAMFNILRNFVEKEIKGDYYLIGNTPEVQNEIKAIYDWWTTKRPQDIHRLDSMSFESRTDESIKAMMSLEEELVQEEEDMMIRLIKIRGYLWT